ncbi:MAG: N-acetylglucosamine-6-phosphate deacetylase, partial [Candidatus Atribacteria bacterium]|nr:N-acetylglucosamine-6-phosphate deacetylase [Candidatus Atribacteria bacterium]
MNECGVRGRVVTSSGVLENGTLVIENGRIVNIDPEPVPPQAFHRFYDFSGKCLFPGLIDLHTHGVLGEDVTDGKVPALRSISQYLFSCGVTGFLATTMTESRERLLRAIEAVVRFQKEPGSGASILGIHLEGPYLCFNRRGAHNARYLRQPDREEMEQFVTAGEGLVKRVTIAPELDGSLKIIRWCTDQGICVSLGHSEADQETCFQAFQQGARLVTHLFNGMDPLHHRKPNLLSFALGFEEIAVELIADFIHVRPEVIEIVLKCKDPDHFLPVSDAVRPTGLTDGRYEFGGEMMEMKNGIARMELTGSLAGSTSPINRGLAHL